MPQGCYDNDRLCNEVIEAGVRIESHDAAIARLEQKMDKLLWAILGALFTSAGSLLMLLIKK